MSTSTAAVAPAVVNGLASYTGTWGTPQANHLLRRCVLGPKREEFIAAVEDGLDATLDKLFAPTALPDPPVNHFFTDDPNVPVGATWVNSPHLENASVGDYRFPSVRAWYFNYLIDAPFSISERLTLFWINHFGMADVSEHRAQYQYIQLFREIGKGSFKTMIERMTIHPSMLNFLNGEWSTKYTPNENYARELLELFTIQKGPQVAEGDYTNYTEQDVRVIARIMTGWRNRGLWSKEDVQVESYFYPEWHDNETDPNNPTQEPKQLSERFGGRIIEHNGAEEYKDLIAVIFEQAETARAMCRELYRYFCYYEISDEVESTVIEPLAEYMIQEDFNIGATLRNLLASEHFYGVDAMGSMIKNPYEFMFSMARPLGGYGHLGLSLFDNDGPSGNLHSIYNIGSAYHWRATTLDMDFLYPPSVAGWKAYYQAPRYYRNWIGSATLQTRRKLVSDFTNRGLYTRVEGTNDYEPRAFDWLGFIDKLAFPLAVEDVVQECAEIFLPRELHPDQFEALKSILTRDVSDDEWTLQYSSYLASPNNPDVVNPITDTVKDFFRALFSMAEFHLQ